MSNAEISMENVVVLFKSFEDLKRDEDLILKEYAEDWEKAYRIFDMTTAALNNDAAALAKFVGPELALAKADAERIKSKFAVPDVQAMVTLVKSLKAAVDKRNARLFGCTALAKRSLRFASSHARKNFGPGATSLPPAS
jgi:hypothetical protein